MQTHKASLTLFLSIGLALTGTALAQDEERTGPSVREQVDSQLEVYRTEMGLSDYTWNQVELILKSGIRERVAIAQRYGLDQEGAMDNLSNKDKRQMRKELKESRKNTEERMERYLDKEQMKAFKQFQEEQRDQMMARLESQQATVADQ